MKCARVPSFLFLLALLCVVFPGIASGDAQDKKTVVTFNQIVEIPSGRLLAPGTYVFKIVESLGYRNIVQIWNDRETVVLATILAVPNYRLEPTGDTIITFYEGRDLGPQALRAWFYPGDNFGQQFVYYPAPLAHLLAELANVVVPAGTAEPNKRELTTVPLVAVTPSGEEESITEAIQTTPDPEQTSSGRTPPTKRSSSQAPEAGQSATTFHAFTELVVVPVNVTDTNGEFVAGLKSENFQVYEDGRLQKITLFKHEDLPVTVGLIVDHSRSMEGKLPAVRKAISSFAHLSNPEDEMFVVDFSDRIWPELFRGRSFTSDIQELEGALMAVGAEGETALYDAVYEGLERANYGHRDKKALIIVSDGGDNASRRKYGEILALARHSETIVYSIGLVGAPGEEENPRILERFSKETGGLAFFPRTLDMVTEISQRIARDLRQQYTIGYVPEKKVIGSEFRKVRVKVSAPGRGKLHVRTRTGYSAAGGKAPAFSDRA